LDDRRKGSPLKILMKKRKWPYVLFSDVWIGKYTFIDHRCAGEADIFAER